MPKVVDPTARRADIVDAVFHVVANGGIQAATLKNVADTAGLAIGSVRHYFDSHEAMLLAAAEAMVERVTARLLAHRDQVVVDPTYDRLVALLEEFLPVDATRQAEVRVWAEFNTAALSRPILHPFAIKMASGTTTVVTAALRRINAPHDPDTVRATIAVIDGLATAGIAVEPIPPHQIRSALRQYLHRLTT